MLSISSLSLANPMLDDATLSIPTECIKLMDITIIDFQISMKPELLFPIGNLKKSAVSLSNLMDL